ncbi:hypothetical protein GGI07_004959 [Coemansia sp. Benny D115]|nr:hypothetical protein GGI07_004959 [Coemansia sp. Benny D115]
MSLHSGSDSESQARVVKAPRRKQLSEIRRINKEKKQSDRTGHEETAIAALAYLDKWKNNQAEWKFMKSRELWIVRHIYQENKIPDYVFPVAVEYLSGLSPGLRKSMIENARLIAQPMTASTPELQRARDKALGLLTVHLTAGQHRSMKRDEARKLLKGEQKEGAKEEKQTSETPVAAANAIERAEKLIEALSAPRPEPVVDSKPKRKADSDSEEDSHSEEPKKKRKSSKDKKDKKEQQEKQKDPTDTEQKEKKKQNKHKNQKKKDKTDKEKKEKKKDKDSKKNKDKKDKKNKDSKKDKKDKKSKAEQ